MDEMKINLTTKFMRKIVAKLLAKFIKSKCGCNVNIQLDELNVSVLDGETTIKTNVVISLDKNEFKKLISKVDVDLD